jgi:hypothetical protein
MDFCRSADKTNYKSDPVTRVIAALPGFVRRLDAKTKSGPAAQRGAIQWQLSPKPKVLEVIIPRCAKGYMIYSPRMSRPAFQFS